MDPLILIIEELHRARGDVEKYETDLSEYEARPDFNHKNARYNRLLLEKDLVLRNLCDLRLDLTKKATDLKGNAIYAREEDGATRYFLDRVPSNTSLNTAQNKESVSEALRLYPNNAQDNVTLVQSYNHQPPSPSPAHAQTQAPAPAPVTKISSARRAHAHSLNVSAHAAHAAQQQHLPPQSVTLHSGSPYTQQTQLAQVTPMNHAMMPQHSSNSVNNNSNNIQYLEGFQVNSHIQSYNQQPYTQQHQPQQPQPHAHTVISTPPHLGGGSYVIASPAGFSGPPTQRRPDPTDLPDLPKYLAAKADLSAIMRDFTDNKIHFVGVDNHVIAMAEYQSISKFTKSGEDPAKFMKGEYRSYKTGYVKKTNSYTENKLFFPVFHPYAPQHISGML